MTLEIFFLSFIPLFVAMDVVGMAPIFLAYTGELDKKQRRKLVLEALFAAFVVANVFLISGKLLLDFLGITIDDFRIAGGIILLILSITDIMSSAAEQRRNPGTDIGVVPLGIPLIVGPAALTTILILIDNFGYTATILSMVLNFIIALVVLWHADLIIKAIGPGGSKAFAKIAALFLAAIAVMMIRVGVLNILASVK